MTNAKILKLLARACPGTRWVRQTKFDTPDDLCFAGIRGKSGIRFHVKSTEPIDLMQAKARLIEKRLIQNF